ncbi:MAG: tetratricopeptide repeat protein [Sphingobacteriales bacterium]|nr:MAG: tetratricopeptide repeat protein [Sphingobacteriales bacterium]
MAKPAYQLLLFSLLLMSATSMTFGQDKELDSLNNSLHKFSLQKNFEADTNYINTLNALAFKLAYYKTDSAILLGNKAAALSKNISYPFGEAEAYKNLGLTYNVRGNYDSAFIVYKAGLAIAEKNHLAATAGRIYHNTAIVYTNLGKYPEALENYFRALKMREESGEKLGQSSSTNGIGTVYFLEGKYGDAVKYYTKAMDLAKEIDYKRGIEAGYANLGEVYYRQGNYDAAQKNLLLALEVVKVTSDLETLAFCKNMLGSIYLKQQKNNDAIREFMESGLVAEELTSKEYKSRSLIGIGQAYLNMHKTDSALFYVQEGYKIANDIKFIELLRDGSEILSNIYESKGNDKQALFYSRQFKIFADSINNQQAQQVTANLTADYEYSKKELLLKSEFENKSTRQRWIIFSAFAGLFSSLIVVWLVYLSRQKEKRTNHLLQQQKTEIEKQKTAAENALSELKAAQTQLIQSEKMASLGELTAGIAHEIQNPLNFVNNFSEVSKELVAEMKEELATGNTQQANEIADDLVQNLEKINHHGQRAADIVKGMLQHSRSSSGTKEPTDINALCDEYLRLAYHGLRAKDKSFNAKFETAFDESIGKVNLIPQEIGRVILNLINNAFYAVSEKAKSLTPDTKGYEPTVTISTKKENDKVLIKVADNGSGIPKKVLEKIFQPFFTTKPTGQGTGLGLSLSYDIIKAHGGKIRVETKEGEGTVFIISLSLNDTV